MNIASELKEGLGISWNAIRANKMRSALTTLGIIIGIVTVTLMGTAIEGLNTAFIRNISFMGADVLYVSRFNWFSGGHEEWEKQQKRRDLTLAQARALERRLTTAKAVAPMAETGRSVQYQKRESSNVRVIGTTDQFLLTSSGGISLGRFITPGESEGGRPVCVIGTEVATNLFKRDSPLGKRVVVGGQNFEVVGVLERQGTFLGLVSLDNQIIVPMKQFVASFWNNPDCTVRVKVQDISMLEESKEEIRSAMRSIRRLAPSEEDDFGINQQDQFVRMFRQLGGTIAAIGLFITGLSLFVGGIGIMNIMFVSVAERTREIGIRKAIGAKRRTILLQFLLEAASICLLGGIIALAIAAGFLVIIRNFIPATMSLSIIGIALLVSAMTGVLSGFFPAWRAARMDPVDALRNE
jgi:putative ABC transport system permease protein